MGFLKNIFSSKKDEAVFTYRDFWNWFEQNEKQFYRTVSEGKNIEADFFDKLSPKLAQLNDGFYFVTGMFDVNTAELIFTAEGTIKNIVFVEELVKAAPAIAGWKFTALKPALDIADIQISMAGNKFSRDNIKFYSNDLPDHPDQIDIVLVHNDYTEENKKNIVNGSFIFLDNFLGELNSASIIDDIKVIGPAEATKELIPIEKLKDFLNWREKEFVEKYDGKRYDIENDEHSVLEAELESGKKLIAVINTDVLQWDSKASHPWMAVVEIKYDGSKNNGMPPKEMFEVLDKIEDEILIDLKDTDGYLYVGRQTCDGLREIYFACNDFRRPSKVLSGILKRYPKQEISFDVFKDKYWMSLNRFQQN